jgi:hypothetical protein
MAKLCTDCGAPIYTSWNVCAECGAPVLDNRKNSRGIPGGKKIRRIKISVLLVMIVGTVIIGSQAGVLFINQKYIFTLEMLRRAQNEGTMSYQEYSIRRDALEYQLDLEEWVISNIIFYSTIGLNIAFVFVVAGFMSISFDNVFNRRTRRISLIIACVFIIFVLYSIFIPTPIIVPYYYY